MTKIELDKRGNTKWPIAGKQRDHNNVGSQWGHLKQNRSREESQSHVEKNKMIIFALSTVYSIIWNTFPPVLLIVRADVSSSSCFLFSLLCQFNATSIIFSLSPNHHSLTHTVQGVYASTLRPFWMFDRVGGVNAFSIALFPHLCFLLPNPNWSFSLVFAQHQIVLCRAPFLVQNQANFIGKFFGDKEPKDTEARLIFSFFSYTRICPLPFLILGLCPKKHFLSCYDFSLTL